MKRQEIPIFQNDYNSIIGNDGIIQLGIFDLSHSGQGVSNASPQFVVEVLLIKYLLNQYKNLINFDSTNRTNEKLIRTIKNLQQTKNPKFKEQEMKLRTLLLNDFNSKVIFAYDLEAFEYQAVVKLIANTLFGAEDILGSCLINCDLDIEEFCRNLILFVEEAFDSLFKGLKCGSIKLDCRWGIHFERSLKLEINKICNQLDFHGRFPRNNRIQASETYNLNDKVVLKEGDFEFPDTITLTKKLSAKHFKALFLLYQAARVSIIQQIDPTEMIFPFLFFDEIGSNDMNLLLPRKNQILAKLKSVEH